MIPEIAKSLGGRKRLEQVERQYPNVTAAGMGVGLGASTVIPGAQGLRGAGALSTLARNAASEVLDSAPAVAAETLKNRGNIGAALKKEAVPFALGTALGAGADLAQPLMKRMIRSREILPWNEVTDAAKLMIADEIKAWEP